MRSIYALLFTPAALAGGLAAWGLLAAALVVALVWAGDVPGWASVGFALPLTLVLVLLLPSAWELSRALPMAARHAALGLSRYLAAALVVGGLWLALAWAWAAVLSEPAWSSVLAASLFALGAGVYLLALLATDALQAWARVRDAQHRAEQAQARAVEAELLMLRNQVNPHFLFNCLNSISALTSFDAPAAREMTLALAQYYRQTLALTQRDWVTLDEELAHCRGYVQIEQVRFADRLRFDCDAAPELGEALLPPMLLQPLVENAVKHGIAPRSEGGVLNVQGQRQGDWLHLRIDNPAGGAEATRDAGTGTGLQNVRQRLHSLYGGQARLNLRTTQGRFVVELTLPWRTGS